MAICSSCGTENADGAKFCNECGTKLGAANLAEERKVVTIVFCDLVGFTQRSETLDPEDVRAFLLPYYDLMTEEVTHHGGVIDKFLGDGVMAVFGAPVAHEDDPERAIRAALKVIERIPTLGLDLHVRVGINTGEVVVVPEAFERGDAITGDAANTASRLQAAAPIDGVVVGERTHEATSHLFDFEVLDPVSVKGKSEPLPIFRPLAPIARPISDLVDDVSPFVGRDFELESLIRLFDRVRTMPSTEFVTIVAEPGIGKSRLVREFARHVEGLPELITWRAGHCLPYGDGISFWALGEIIKAHAGIFDNDDQATLESKLDNVLVEPDEGLRSWMRSRIAPLVGLETMAEPPQQEEAFTAWRRFVEQIAQHGPTVLVVEDLHWADDSLVAFLQHLAERTSGLPILVLTTARPEVEERHPTWLGRARRSTVMPLTALADSEMTILLEATMEGASSELVSTVLVRAGGSPLYAEQLAAMLREQALPIAGGSLDDTAIPASIQALLAARLDALSSELKAILLDASVVGKTFWSGAIDAQGEHPDLEASLAELSRRDFVRPAFPSSIDGELEYSFVHALARDVAYTSIPRHARMTRHRDVAVWIMGRTANAPGEDAEIVVAHLEHALELATAAGTDGRADIVPLLVEALTAAGEQSTRTDMQRAVSWFERVLDLTPAGDPRRPDALVRFAEASAQTARYSDALKALDEAVTSFRERGDARATARALLDCAVPLQNLGDPRFWTLPSEVLTVLEALPPCPELVDALARAGWSESSLGRSEEGIRYALQAVDVAREIGSDSGEAAVQALGYLGDFRATLGDASGIEQLRAAMELADETGRDTQYARMQLMLAVLLWQFEGPVASLQLLREAIAFSGARGYRQLVDVAQGAMLDALVDAGLFEEALATANDLARRASDEDVWSQLGVAAARAEISALQGRAEEQLDRLPWLEAASRDTGALDWLIMGLASSAIVRASAGDRTAAAALVEEVASAPDVSGNVNYAAFLPALVRIALSDGDRALAERVASGLEPRYPYMNHALVSVRAAVAESAGDIETAIDTYADAASRWRDFGVVPEQAYALAGRGRCLLALGKSGEGVVALEESREIWVGMRAAPLIGEIDELLATVS